MGVSHLRFPPIKGAFYPDFDGMRTKRCSLAGSSNNSDYPRQILAFGWLDLMSGRSSVQIIIIRSGMWKGKADFWFLICLQRERLFRFGQQWLLQEVRGKVLSLPLQDPSLSGDISCYLMLPPCSLLSNLLTFIQTWLDEYNEDFRDPPLHPALRLLLEHLRISSAVHDGMRSQPNFCSLAGQAEELLQKFQKEEGDH